MFKLNFRGRTPQNHHFWKKGSSHFFWKYLICGFKIEISGYSLKVPIITYSPYKYEVNRTKTHEMRAKCFFSFVFSLSKSFVKRVFLQKENQPLESSAEINNCENWITHQIDIMNIIWNFESISRTFIDDDVQIRAVIRRGREI